MLSVDLHFLELLLSPAPSFDHFSGPIGDARKLLGIALEEPRRDHKYAATHSVGFGFAVIDYQFVTQDPFFYPTQECLIRVVR